MPDPSISDALAEANAIAPVDDIIWHTIEIRHEAFVDDNGDPDSLRFVQAMENMQAPLEDGAPVRAGQWVTWTALGFRFYLPSIEPGITPEIEITVDGVNRQMMSYLDQAVASGKPLWLSYRPYLDGALDDGPQMDPVPTFQIADVKVGIASVTLKARTKIDLRGAFPVAQYTLDEYPGLAGR